ncbi:Rrb1p [Saccharomyces cerevisiae x Saccharomyces kudriavzevii VIN7]|uniref:Rrb1p n=1 Tax=Saccharomyces cerevisiae x Saccharomyces kudriavzevii (strain VIN7) TaxID=1095631 RepID=H0GZD9_SACCK|nr:Rrb1p [Saccharomyces cerevisiae x Saccharomyces kudriavzevii VIN7]
MSKRSIEIDEPDRVVSAKTQSHSVPTVATSEEQDAPMNELEDQLSDECDSDGEIIEIDGDDDIIDEDDLKKKQEEAETLVQKDQSEGNEENVQELYLPHMSRPLGPDEVLEADPSVYEMLHNVNMPWPCLTLDVIPDTLGSERRNYPQSILLTTATQSSRKRENELMVLALSNLTKTLLKDDNEEDDDEEEEDDADAVIENENIPLKDTTNRLKVSPFAASNQEVLTATMSENGDVYIYDLAPQSKAFSTPGYQISKSAKRPIHTVKSHGNVEGYGLDWSPLIKTGALLSGDCSGQIYFTQRHTSRWVTDKQPFTVSNNKSIEDIQWSRTESTVFATAGCDGYIRIWDTRIQKNISQLSP